MNSKEVNWLESTHLEAVKIDNEYGKKESNISIIIMACVVGSLVTLILGYFVLNYGDIIIKNIRNFFNNNNILNSLFMIILTISIIAFLIQIVFSVIGIRKSLIGINHQVNTKENLKISIVSISVSSGAFILFGLIFLMNYLILRF